MGGDDANGTRSRIWTDAQGQELFVEVNRISTVTPAGQKRGAAGLGRSMEGTAFHGIWGWSLRKHVVPRCIPRCVTATESTHCGTVRQLL